MRPRAGFAEVVTQDEQRQGQHAHDRDVTAQQLRFNGHGLDGGCQANDAQSVEEVGADDVAQRQVVLALASGGHGRSQLGQRGADRHDGQADDQEER